MSTEYKKFFKGYIVHITGNNDSRMSAQCSRKYDMMEDTSLPVQIRIRNVDYLGTHAESDCRMYNNQHDDISKNDENIIRE